VKRIVIHWTAGAHLSTATDREHYHVLIEGDGKVVHGRRAPEANRSTSDGDYAAHTRALNTGSIGVAVCAMRQAREHPFYAGPDPITTAQEKALVRACADLCDTYGIPVTRQTVLTHAEVQPTLGVWQRGKWDITWLPNMDAPGDPIAVGDQLRSAMVRAMGPALPVDPDAEVWASIKASFARFMAWLRGLGG
jgi:hypothetical protein